VNRLSFYLPKQVERQQLAGDDGGDVGVPERGVRLVRLKYEVEDITGDKHHLRASGVLLEVTAPALVVHPGKVSH